MLISVDFVPTNVFFSEKFPEVYTDRKAPHTESEIQRGIRPLLLQIWLGSFTLRGDKWNQRFVIMCPESTLAPEDRYTPGGEGRDTMTNEYK